MNLLPDDTPYQAKVYDIEKNRQDAFLSWYSTHFRCLPGIKVLARSTDNGSNDGEITIRANGNTYVLGLLEVKNEGGDALFQALRYVQMLYKVS